METSSFVTSLIVLGILIYLLSGWRENIASLAFLAVLVNQIVYGWQLTSNQSPIVIQSVPTEKIYEDFDWPKLEVPEKGTDYQKLLEVYNLPNVTTPQDYRNLMVAAMTVQKVRYLNPYRQFAAMGRESNYNPNAVSPKGAVGLMQLMPATAKQFGVNDRKDPIDNVLGSLRYWDYLYEMFQDNNLELAAYNAGHNAVKRHGNIIPPYEETQNYVRIINSRTKALQKQGIGWTVCKSIDCIRFKHSIKATFGNGATHEGLIALMARTQTALDSRIRDVTSGNDKYHKQKYSSDNGHVTGLAFDVVPKRQSYSKQVLKFVKATTKNCDVALSKKTKALTKCNGCKGAHHIHIQMASKYDADKLLLCLSKQGAWDG
jgi:hypothetical protein